MRELMKAVVDVLGYWDQELGTGDAVMAARCLMTLLQKRRPCD
jgi:hypothetical protein